MILLDRVQAIPGVDKWSHNDKIRFFAWHLHKDQAKEAFSVNEIASCYRTIPLEQPSNLRSHLASLESKRPKDMLKDKNGYCLAKHVRDSLDAKYGQRAITVQVHQLLSELPAKIPDLNERQFLDEALRCFRHGAFRAAEIMAWNLAFSHFTDWLFKKHLPTFNTQWPVRYPKQHKDARISAVTKIEDFQEFKESEVIEIARSAAIITNDVLKILKDKLDKRNTAAHPNSIVITQVQAEDFVTDLVNNVVLTLL